MRCKKAGVVVPGLRIVDLQEGVLGMEWIEGWSVREVLGGGQDDEGVVDEDEEEDEDEEDVILTLQEMGIDQGMFTLVDSVFRIPSGIQV